MQDLNSKSSIQDSLAQTMAWCSMQNLTTEPVESEEVKNQRSIFKEACSLIINSYRFTGTPSKRAEELMKQVDYRSLILLAYQLRSLSLKPAIEMGESVEDEQREQAVSELISKRADLLISNGVTISEVANTNSKGKFLACAPAENVADGASEYASKGFFDVNDIPPWDTWFYFKNGLLLSWVPEALVPLAQQGIDANPVDCIHWAEKPTLRQLGL